MLCVGLITIKFHMIIADVSVKSETWNCFYIFLSPNSGLLGIIALLKLYGFTISYNKLIVGSTPENNRSIFNRKLSLTFLIFIIMLEIIEFLLNLSTRTWNIFSKILKLDINILFIYKILLDNNGLCHVNES